MERLQADPLRSWTGRRPPLVLAGLPAHGRYLGTEQFDLFYRGDVSSQVYEVVGQRPRPCIFLDPHRRAWHDDGNLRMLTHGIGGR